MSVGALRERIETLASEDSPDREESRRCVEELLAALEKGSARAAEPEGADWRVNPWVKKGILLGFRVGANRSSDMPPVFRFRDRDTFPTWDPTSTDRDVRIVPGGSTIRRGAYIGNGVVVMPPAYVNVGAWIGEGTMVDSHALVGSCAQVGARVHLSAASQVGGVLEPVGARPVILEDDVFVGGNCGVYEGTMVRSGAVLAAGVILTGSVPVYDLVRETVHRATVEEPLVIPEGAVVVPGARPAAGGYAEEQRVHLQTPVIVKYRDGSTDAAAALEEALR